MINLDKYLRPGKSFRYSNAAGVRIFHIRAIVDNDQIVFKWYSRSRRSWVYEIWWLYEFEYSNKYGRLSARGKVNG